MRMVRVAPKPSFRDASCCRVEVVKGAAGLRRTRPRSTLWTENAPASIAPTAALAAPSSESASLSSFLPERCVSCAVTSSPLGVRKAACTDQYSCARNASISVSRSQMSRSATD